MQQGDPVSAYERSSTARLYGGDGVGDFDWSMAFIVGVVLFFVGIFVWFLVSTFTHTPKGIEYTGPKVPPSCGSANQAWCDTFNQ
jgi:hypothetical protein